uniref:Peroxisomal coenzyme A diphosphatase NUDT7 n=1 Tax=Leptobrachium leishanense TaxID=445787 RepID=A0A8C5R5H4_9ANUR
MMSSVSDQLEGEQDEKNKSSVNETVKRLIRKYDVGDRYVDIPLVKASILLPLLYKQDKLYLVLTVRSMNLKLMPGDVCFPGGRREPTDGDDIQTALREANEEIGLQPSQVEIIGRLVPYLSKSPVYLITPVIALVDETFQPCPHPDEVMEVFLVPLEFFISSEHYTPLSFGSYKFHSFQYEDKEKQKTFKIWGLTAHFAVILSAILLEKVPSFEFDLEQMLAECDHILAQATYPSKL